MDIMLSNIMFLCFDQLHALVIQFNYYNYQQANKSLSNVVYLDLIIIACFHEPPVLLSCAATSDAVVIMT